MLRALNIKRRVLVKTKESKQKYWNAVDTELDTIRKRHQSKKKIALYGPLFSLPVAVADTALSVSSKKYSMRTYSSTTLSIWTIILQDLKLDCLKRRTRTDMDGCG